MRSCLRAVPSRGCIGGPMNETTDFSLFPGSHRLADLARHVPRVVWPFIVLAAVQTILFVGMAYLDFRNIAIWVIPTPVSYTHLRAHETVLDLVCRLLL